MERSAIESKLKEITDKIVREFQPEKIILFGSWAWGESQEWSAVDLFIIKRSEKRRFERANEIQSFLSPRTMSVDILVYTPEEVKKSINENRNLFIEDIMRNGRTLYSRPESPFIFTLPHRQLTVLY